HNIVQDNLPIWTKSIWPSSEECDMGLIIVLLQSCDANAILYMILKSGLSEMTTGKISFRCNYPFIPLFMFMLPNDCGSALYRFIIYRLHFVYVQNYLHIFFAKIVRWLLLQYIIFFLFLLLILHFHRSTDRLLRKSYAHHPHYDVSAIMVTAEAGLKIRVVARETNEELRAIKADPAEGFDIGAILSIAKRELNSEHEATRIEALHWFFTLLDRYCAE
ncbi:hypothetical protein ACJX0J_015617, partial [Zea mays]